MQLQHQVPGKVPQGTEGSGADTQVRFRKMQSLGEVPEGSGGEGIGAEGSGADIEVRFWKVLVQKQIIIYKRQRRTVKLLGIAPEFILDGFDSRKLAEFWLNTYGRRPVLHKL